MKKILLSLIAVVAIAVACGGNAYLTEMTKLVDETVVKYDSVNTIEQYNELNSAYITAAQQIVEKYPEVSEEDAKKAQELSVKFTAANQAALERIQAAVAAQQVADSTVVDSTVVVK